MNYGGSTTNARRRRRRRHRGCYEATGNVVEIVCRHTRGEWKLQGEEGGRGGQGTGGKAARLTATFYIPCLRWPRFLAVSLFTPRRLRSNASVVPLSVVSRFADQFPTFFPLRPLPPSCRLLSPFYRGEFDVVTGRRSWGVTIPNRGYESTASKTTRDLGRLFSTRRNVFDPAKLRPTGENQIFPPSFTISISGCIISFLFRYTCRCSITFGILCR